MSWQSWQNLLYTLAMTDEQRRSLAWGLAAVAGGIVLWQLWPRLSARALKRPAAFIKQTAQPPEPAQENKTADISLNSAGLDELKRLPGIGPELAGRIVAARPFHTIDDLLEVSGIGPATLDGLRSDATV